MGDIERHAQRLSDLLELMRTLSTYGCTDGHCAINCPAKGLHTNGGCRCIRSIGELGLEIAVEAERLERHMWRRHLPPPTGREVSRG